MQLVGLCHNEERLGITNPENSIVSSYSVLHFQRTKLLRGHIGY